MKKARFEANVIKIMALNEKLSFKKMSPARMLGSFSVK